MKAVNINDIKMWRNVTNKHVSETTSEVNFLLEIHFNSYELLKAKR
jgi:hypothetical protein